MTKTRDVQEKINEERTWHWSRRRFFKNMMLVAAASQVSWLESCSLGGSDFHPLSRKQFRILQCIQNILFPDVEPGPGAQMVNADKYIIWMLNDDRMDPEENDYLIRGLERVEEEVQKVLQRSFLQLSFQEQEEMVKHILENTSWGESWLSVNLSYIFEAMISDPIYGFNSEEIGWEWLEHIPGFPRPEPATMYDSIFNSVKSNGI